MLNNFFQQEIELSATIHLETDKMHGLVEDIDPEDFHDLTVYESNEALKRKIGLPQLTAARMVCAQHGKKVFFGKPDPLLVIEDLCDRLTLRELQEIFDDVIN